MKSKGNRTAATLGNHKQTPAYNNSAVSQRARILKHFEKRSRLSTFEASRKSVNGGRA
jgi:hypothetical protein